MRRWMVGGGALAVIAVCVLVNAQQRSAVRDRIAAGSPVQAQVLEAHHVSTRRQGEYRMTVRYPVAATIRTASVMSVDFGPPWHAAGTAVTVYVDPDDPARVATVDGYTSADIWAFLPRLIGLIALCPLIVVGVVSLSVSGRR